MGNPISILPLLSDEKKIDSFKNRLKEALEKKDISQSELSNISGIDTGSITHYLQGNYEPKSLKLHKLAKALNVDAAWLMGANINEDGSLKKEVIPLPKNYYKLSNKNKEKIKKETTTFLNQLVEKYNEIEEK